MNNKAQPQISFHKHIR
jgi:hypothetical protein